MATGRGPTTSLTKTPFGSGLWTERPNRGHFGSRVARFFTVQHTKTGKNKPNDHKMYQRAIKYTIQPYNGQNGDSNTDIFHCKTFQNLPKVGFLVRKYTHHLATLSDPL
jgi:hypothetical protein